jgi:dipeptidyl aminopeptidase/acylaminoacyl peptidase
LRSTFRSVVAALVVALSATAPAAASYAANSTPLVWEEQTWNIDGSQGAAILDAGGTLTSCDNSPGDQLCLFGRPTVSPDGSSIVVSRHATSSGIPFAPAGPGVLVLLDADGANLRALPQLTATDTQPAFLPGGQRIVFTGRREPGSPSQLYEVNVDGSGLRQLTFRGGSWAAPCANGAIVFERRADLWLIPAHGNHWTRLVRGGSEPDCAPNSRAVVYVTRNHSRLALIGLNGHGGKLLPHGRGAAEEPDRPAGLFSPAFSPDGRSIAYLRSYDVLQQDGSRNELDICDLGGRIAVRRDIADQAGGSIGSDADQSVAQYVDW